MSALTGPVAVVALVVAFAAVVKVLDPVTTTGALRAAGVPARDGLVRLGALTELVIAGAVLVTGGRVALLALAISYAGFTVFVAVALGRDRPLATCGCVGRADAPPSAVHVVLDGSAALVATVAALVGTDAPVRVVTSTTPLVGLNYVVLVVTGASLFVASITVLPALLRLRAPTRAVRA
jgi:hypothetical protein